MSNYDKSKFQFYYKSFKNGNYYGVTPTEDSMDKIENVIKKLKLKTPIESDNIHVTLMYSEHKGNPMIPPSSDLSHIATPVCFALFGPEKDCLVIKLESSDLQNRHNELLAQGFIHSYDDYKPHITLTYDFEGDDLPDEKILEELGELEFTNEYIMPIEEDWSRGK